MKALILAGGYGTRLQRDIKADESGRFKHLSGVPKPLLPIGGVPLSSHLMAMLEEVSDRVDRVYIVTNKLYLNQFRRWASEWPSVEVICDGSMSNEERPGSVGTIAVAVHAKEIQDDLLILGGDTLFKDDFVLGEFLDGYSKVNKRAAGYATTVKCSDEATWKTGIVEVDNDGCVTSFLEKVGPEKTKSRLSVPCFYLLSKDCLHLIDTFLEEKKDLPISEKDASGLFIKYLSERESIYTFPISGRFDVGSLDSYEVCNQYFMGKKADQADNDNKS